MKTAKDNWTIEDFSVEDVKAGRFIPNWLRAGYDSKAQFLDDVMRIIGQSESRFAALGLQPGQITKKIKKR